MAIRKDIVWTVSGDGLTILPAGPQDGGMQGEDNAVRVKFVFGTDHPLLTGGYRLYIECIDPTGAYDKTEVLEADAEGAVAVPVGLAWTQYGGTVSLNVAAEKDGEKVILDSVQLTFRNRNTATKRMQTLIQTYIQKLLDRAKEVLTGAQAAATSAEESAATAAAAAQGCYNNATAAKGYAEVASDVASVAQGYLVGVEATAVEVENNLADANNAAQGALSYLESTKGYAAGAEKAATAAEESAAAAANAANGVQEYAQGCYENAQAAQGYANTASNAAAAASNFATTASNASTNASNAASAAEESAAEAQLAVTAARQQAKYAQNHANNAEQSAEAAEESAAEAAEAATRAEVAADRAEQSGGGGGSANVVYTDVDIADDGEGRVTLRVQKNATATAAGGGMLVVGLSEDGETATHTAGEIYAHVQKGGNAVLEPWSGCYIPLTYYTGHTAMFCYIADDMLLCHYTVNAYRSVYSIVDMGVPRAEYVQNIEDRVGNIDAALDELHAYAQALIGGEGE